MAWNKSFKVKVTEKYDAWKADRAHSITAAGNMRGPPHREIVKWVLEALEILDRELIIRYPLSVILVMQDRIAWHPSNKP